MLINFSKNVTSFCLKFLNKRKIVKWFLIIYGKNTVIISDKVNTPAHIGAVKYPFNHNKNLNLLLQHIKP